MRRTVVVRRMEFEHCDHKVGPTCVFIHYPIFAAEPGLGSLAFQAKNAI